MSITLPTEMRALAIHEGGLREVSLPLPSLQPGEVLIRVAYAGLNQADTMQIAGDYAPPEGASPLPGLEVSGWIVTAGHGFSAGQEVCALLSGGGFAEYVAVPAGQVLALPQRMDLQQAATLPEAATTSVMALVQEANLQPGERVLVHGGASGLGILMTQIAKTLGAEVVATVGTAEKAAKLQSLGIRAINHTTEKYAEILGPESVDVIIDTLGGGEAATHLRLLKPHGRMVTLAMLKGGALPDGFKMTRLLMNQLQWRGAMLRGKSTAQKAEIMQIVAERLWPALADGRIQPVVDSVFALSDAKKALNRMQERLHMGKILLEVAP